MLAMSGSKCCQSRANHKQAAGGQSVFESSCWCWLAAASQVAVLAVHVCWQVHPLDSLARCHNEQVVAGFTS